MKERRTVRMNPIPLAAVKEKAKTDALRSNEQDAITAYGENRVERKFRKDGNYSWRVRLEQNDGHGKLTKDGAKLQELLVPAAQAETERVAKQQGFPGAYAAIGSRRRTLMRTIAGKLYRVADGALVPV